MAGSEESEEPLDNVLKILPPVVLNSKRYFLQIVPEEEVRAELFFSEITQRNELVCY